MIDGDVSASTGRTTADEPVRRRVRRDGIREQSARGTRRGLAASGQGSRREAGAARRAPAAHDDPPLRDASAGARRRGAARRAQAAGAARSASGKRAGKVRDVDVHLHALRTRCAGRRRRGERPSFASELAEASAPNVGSGWCERSAPSAIAGSLKRLAQGRRARRSRRAADATRIASAILVRIVDQFDAGATRGRGRSVPRTCTRSGSQTKRLRYLAETASPHARRRGSRSRS